VTFRPPEKVPAAYLPAWRAPAKTEKFGHHLGRERRRKQPTNNRRSKETEGRTRREVRTAPATSRCPPAGRGEQTDWGSWRPKVHWTLGLPPMTSNRPRAHSSLSLSVYGIKLLSSWFIFAS